MCHQEPPSRYSDGTGRLVSFYSHAADTKSSPSHGVRRHSGDVTSVCTLCSGVLAASLLPPLPSARAAQSLLHPFCSEKCGNLGASGRWKVTTVRRVSVVFSARTCLAADISRGSSYRGRPWPEQSPETLLLAAAIEWACERWSRMFVLSAAEHYHPYWRAPPRLRWSLCQSQRDTGFSANCKHLQTASSLIH